MTADPDRSTVYLVEPLAYSNSPLDDRLSEGDITTSYGVILTSGRLGLDEDDVGVVPARSDMTNWGGYYHSGRQTIQTSAGRQRRWIVAHELAHALADHVWYRSYEPCDSTSHGASWRALDVYVTAQVFGSHYGSVLRATFEQAGLFVPFQEIEGLPPIEGTPIINIDALSVHTAPVGGWRRHR